MVTKTEYHKKAQTADDVDKMKKAAVVRENIPVSVFPDGGECKSNNLQQGAVGVVQYQLLPPDKTLNGTK